MILLLLSSNIKAFPTESKNAFSVFDSETSSLQSSSPNAYCDGDGTISTPYEICDAATLAYLATQVNAGNSYEGIYFRLTNDINLENYGNWIPIGNAANPFKGFFDAANYRITNLQIDRPTEDYIGLFGYIGTGSVVENLQIYGKKGAGIKGRNYVGLLAGYSNEVTIRKCYVQGAVSGVDLVGGLIGSAVAIPSSTTVITQCYAFVLVSASGEYGTGGLVGKLQMSLSNSYAVGNVYNVAPVSTNGGVGALAGTNNNGIISYCYSTGNISANATYCGGLVGNQETGSSNIKNSVTMNSTINGGSDCQRITGGDPIGGISYNYAWEGTLVNGVPVISNNRDSKDGDSKSLSDLKSYNFYTESSNTWSWPAWSISKIGAVLNTWNIWDENSHPYFQHQSAPVVPNENPQVHFGKLRPDVWFDSVLVYRNGGSVLAYLTTAEIDNINHTWTLNSGLLQSADTLLLIAYESGKAWPSYPVKAIFENTSPCVQLKGNQYIPGDFASLKDAADYYNTCGLQDSTTFIIIGDITETQTVEFKGTAPGSKQYPLVITTDGSRRTVSGNISGPLVKLTAANNITFEGIVPADKDHPNANLLVFTNTNPNAENIAVVQVTKDAVEKQGSNIVVKNIEISNISKQHKQNYGLYISTDSIIVEACYIHDIGNGIYYNNTKRIQANLCVLKDLVFNGITETNATAYTDIDYHISQNYISGMINNSDGNISGISISANSSSGTIHIRNNTIENIEHNTLNTSNRAYGIYSTFSGENNIIKNVVRNVNGNAAQAMAIYALHDVAGYANIDSCSVDNISGNTLGLGIRLWTDEGTGSGDVRHCSVSNIAGTVSCYGMSVIGGGAETAQNKVWNIYSGQGYVYYFYNFGETTPTRRIKIINNMFSGYLTSYLITGIHIEEAVHFSINHNTFVVDKKEASNDDYTTSPLSLINIRSSTTEQTAEIRNNIFVNKYVNKPYNRIIYLENAQNGKPAFSDNIYDFGGTAVYAVTGNPSTTYNDLDAWNAYSGDNGQNLSVSFVDPANGDAHLAEPSLTDARLAVPLLSNVPMDFDGQLRTVCNNAAGSHHYQGENIAIKNIVMPAICENDSAFVSLNIITGKSGAQSTYQYKINDDPEWNNAAVNASFADYDSLAFYPLYADMGMKTSGIYNLVISDTNHCQTDTAISLEVNPLPMVQITSNKSSICDNEEVELTITGTKGQAPWAITVDNGIGDMLITDENPANFYIQPHHTTTYTIIRIEDDNGCEYAP